MYPVPPRIRMSSGFAARAGAGTLDCASTLSGAVRSSRKAALVAPAIFRNERRDGIDRFYRCEGAAIRSATEVTGRRLRRTWRGKTHAPYAPTACIRHRATLVFKQSELARAVLA